MFVELHSCIIRDMMTKIHLKPGFAKPLWAGNPLVYPKAVEQWPSHWTFGEWVQVNDASGQMIGHGVYNPHSLYRIRILAWARENLKAYTLEAALQHRIAQAIALRHTLHLPNELTNAYRLINSEGDQLSGVTVDIFHESAVIAVTAAWALKHQSLLEATLRQYLPEHRFIWRFMEKSLKQEGWDQALPTFPKPEQHTKIQIKELGLVYEMDPYQGQKTGFYCDQRDTRTCVQHYAQDRDVLDLYCFSGAFSLHAALGGARSVRGVDSSHSAIEAAQRNAALNDLTHVVFEEADASEVLTQIKNVDFIILDPPKLAPSHKHLHKALRHYGQINELALRALPQNGLLLTCSCSQAVSLQDLQQVLVGAALRAGKSVQMLHHGGAGADHPINLAFMESAYLKWILVRVL